MSNIEEDIDPEGYHTIMAYIKKVDERIEALKTQLTELEEACKKCVEDRGKVKEAIVADCQGCNHPLTDMEIKESTCPYCRQSSKYTPRSSETR